MRNSVTLILIGLISFASNVLMAKAPVTNTISSTNENTVQNVNNNMISAVNIQDRTIQVGQFVYGLADAIEIYSSDNQLLSQLALMPGEIIEYTLAKQTLDMSKNIPTPPAQVITSIRILSKFDANAIAH
jgi:hypothetical protein